MEAAHLHVVRIGEFAWSSEEPAEGRYEFDWLERAIRLAEKHHIAVVLGTPTDAPPAWLTAKYPETLRMAADGRRAEHGGRRQFNYADPLYRKFCAEIATQLARRFGHDPDVIGRGVAGGVGRRIREHQIGRAAEQSAQMLGHGRVAQIPLHEESPGQRLDRQKIDAHDPPRAAL